MDTEPPVPPATPAPDPAMEDKTVAIVSYLTLIGFIIAIVMHGNKKTRLGAFHLRQMLGLSVLWLGMWVLTMLIGIIPIIGWIIALLLGLAMFVLIIPWVMGLIAAANGQMKPVPVVGEHFQKWFATAFQ